MGFSPAPRTVGDQSPTPRPCWPTSAQFDEATLRAAKVLSTSPEEGLHLSPLFAGPDAALIALRDPRDGPLQGLLTARGCLPRHYLPIDAVQKDHWTREAVQVMGVLFATSDIQEVALLQALGLPATLSLGLHRLTLSGLDKLNSSFEDNPSAGHPLRSCRAGVGCAWGNTPCLISLTSRMTMSWQHGS